MKKIALILLTIVLVLSFAACGSETSKTPGTSKAKVNKYKESEGTAKSISEIDFKSNDKQFVYKLGEDYYIHYLDGKKVTGMEQYVHHADKAEMEKAIADVNSNPCVESCEQIEDWLVLRYKESEWSRMSLDELELVYGDYKL